MGPDALLGAQAVLAVIVGSVGTVLLSHSVPAWWARVQPTMRKVWPRWRQIGVLLLVLAATYLVLVRPSQEVPAILREGESERLALVNEYRRTWAGVVGGAAVLLGVWIGWIRASAAQRTVEAMEQGQITERFTRAVDQLGSVNAKGEHNVDIRLGAIFALEQIAKDQPKKYFWQVVEVLAAYLRANAYCEYEYSTEDGPEFVPAGAAAGREDGKAAIAAIGRLGTGYHPQGTRLNLANVKVTNADLHDAYLAGVDFTGADLAQANLSEALIVGAVLSDAMLHWAKLDGTDLGASDLRGANFGNHRFRAERIKNVNFGGALRPENDMPGWDVDDEYRLRRVSNSRK